jgi:aspartate aminotransferase
MRAEVRAEHFDIEDGYRAITAAHALEAAGRSIVHLDLGEPGFATPGHIVEAGVRALHDGYTHYTEPGGMIEARAAIGEHIRRTRNVDVSPEHVIITSGASQALLLTMLALVQPGSSVILPDPRYPAYSELVRMAGGRVISVPLKSELGFRYDLDELEAAIDQSTRVILINSPHNPTGGVLSEADLRAIGELAERHDLYIVSDEVYADLVYDGGRAPSMLSVPGMRERVICIDSFSKVLAMCGWRLGFLAAPAHLSHRLEMMMFAAALCTSSIAQVAAIKLVRSPATGDEIARMRDAFGQRRELMLGHMRSLPGFGCVRPLGAFYVFPDVRGVDADDRCLAERLLFEGGVSVIPGSAFGRLGAGHLRLSYAASAEQIGEGMQRIRRLLAGT